MINDLRNKRYITIYDNKKIVRTFTYIEDAIYIILKLIENTKNYNLSYNIGSNHSLSINELSKKIIKTFSYLQKKDKSSFKIILNKKIKDPIFERKPETNNIKKIIKNFKFTDFDKSLETTMNSILKK